ncbi:hypothetical protein J6590_044511 [Homalodisca vitripennis]|nr:hypothetical protein J6590_044511 [Homalodisca vitripennis]
MYLINKWLYCLFCLSPICLRFPRCRILPQELSNTALNLPVDPTMRRFPQQYLRRHSLSQDPCHDTHYTASLKKGLAQPFMRVLMALAEGFMAVPYVNSQAATAAAARRPAP